MGNWAYYGWTDWRAGRDASSVRISSEKGAEFYRRTSIRTWRKIHRVLYEASDSRILEHVLTDFHKYVKLARKTSVGEEHRAEKSIQEHRAILEAIKQKDADKAEELANQHIKNVMQNLHLEE